MLKLKKLIAKYWAKRPLWLFVHISQRKKTSKPDDCPTLTLLTNLYTSKHIH